MGAPLGLGINLLLGPKISTQSTAGHSYCQKIKKMCLLQSLVLQKKNLGLLNFCHFPCPTLLMATCLHHLQEGRDALSSSSSL